MKNTTAIDAATCLILHEMDLFKKETVSPHQQQLKSDILDSLGRLIDAIKSTDESIARLLGTNLQLSLQKMEKVLKFIKEFHSNSDIERENRFKGEMQNEIQRLVASETEKLFNKRPEKDKTIVLLSQPGITIDQIKQLIDAQTSELEQLGQRVTPPPTENYDAQTRLTRLQTKLEQLELELKNTSALIQNKADDNKRQLQQDIENIHSINKNTFY